MADVLYIDCNRKLSIKSEENTNEWEFKLQDEALLLPQGTQVSIQESFINKKGVSGNTIVIDEPITTTIQYGYYISHSPVFAPSTQSIPLAGSLNLFTNTLDTLGASNLGTHNMNDRDWKNVSQNQPVVDMNVLKSFGTFGGYEKPLCAVKIT